MAYVATRFVRISFVAVRFVAKRFVVVAEVPVAFWNVKLARVEEPFTCRFERVVKPPVALSVPVKLAAKEIVWPLMRPEVTVPKLALFAERLIVKRFVDEAVEAKKFVVVAFVVVELITFNPKIFAAVEERFDIVPLRAFKIEA